MRQQRALLRSAWAVRSTTLILGAGLVIAGALIDLGEPGFGQGQKLLMIIGILFALGSLLPLEWNNRLLLLAGAVGLSLLFAELALQVFLRPRFSTSYQLDCLYLHKYIPNTTRRFQRLPVNGGQTIAIKINSRGYRGEEFRHPRASKRIVVYGDSFIAADYSRLQQTFVEQLESRLNSAQGADVEAINAGVTAYGPDQIAVRMEQEILRLELDLIIIALFAGNDFGDILRNKIFKLDEDGHLRYNSFVIGDTLRKQFSHARNVPIVYKLLLKSWRLLKHQIETAGAHYDPAERQMEIWLQRCRDEYQEYVIQGNNEVRNIFSDSYDADLSLTPKSDSAIYKQRLMEEVLLKIREIAELRGIRIVFLVIPSPLDICHNYDIGKIDLRKYPDYRRSTLTAALESILQRNGMKYLNLFERFGESNANELYFHGGDIHWNDAGQALAADLMHRYILDEDLL